MSLSPDLYEKGDRTVCLDGCADYDPDRVLSLLRGQFRTLRVTDAMRGRRVVIKPNLIMKASPDRAATTHPAVVEAAARLAIEAGAASVVIAESSGGPYVEASLNTAYRVCGIDGAAERSGAVLNTDTSFRPVDLDGETVDLIAPILDADVILNLAKLKTHALTRMTASVKNLFGCVPGIEKFSLHARYNEPDDFCDFILRLCAFLHREKTVIDVVDAVVGMEGNGPTGGSPRPLGYLLSSRDPFALDAVCEHLMGFDGTVPMVTKARDAGLCPPFSDLILLGGDGSPAPETDGLSPFRLPDAGAFSFLRRIPPFLRPRPVVASDRCRGCGECARSCPAHTIEMKDGKARIRARACIRCFCCQELCPFRAVDVKKYFIFNFIK